MIASHAVCNLGWVLLATLEPRSAAASPLTCLASTYLSCLSGINAAAAAVVMVVVVVVVVARRRTEFYVDYTCDGA